MKHNIYTFVSLIFILCFAISCSGSESDEGENTVTYITISSSEKNVLLGNYVKFRATDNLNNDISSNAVFLVNGQPINGNEYTPVAVGTYTVTAKMSDFISKPLTFSVNSATGVNFVYRMLYEDFTGTWCGNCPIASVRYENLLKENNKVVFLGVHGPQGTNDPYINSASQGIINNAGVWGYPTILLNRSSTWSTNNNNYTDMSFAISKIKPYSKIGIATDTHINGNSVTGSVSISFAEGFSNLKLAIYAVENDLIYPQHNYFNGSGGKPVLYGGVALITDYKHHNVLRGSLTDVGGDAISSENTQNGSIYTKSISYNLPAGVNPNNTKLIVIVFSNNKEALNTREVEIGNKNNLETL